MLVFDDLKNLELDSTRFDRPPPLLSGLFPYVVSCIHCGRHTRCGRFRDGDRAWPECGMLDCSDETTAYYDMYL